jgi:hypothetical protein
MQTGTYITSNPTCMDNKIMCRCLRGRRFVEILLFTHHLTILKYSTLNYLFKFCMHLSPDIFEKEKCYVIHMT